MDLSTAYLSLFYHFKGHSKECAVWQSISSNTYCFIVNIFLTFYDEEAFTAKDSIVSLYPSFIHAVIEVGSTLFPCYSTSVIKCYFFNLIICVKVIMFTFYMLSQLCMCSIIFDNSSSGLYIDEIKCLKSVGLFAFVSLSFIVNKTVNNLMIKPWPHILFCFSIRSSVLFQCFTLWALSSCVCKTYAVT